MFFQFLRDFDITTPKSGQPSLHDANQSSRRHSFRSVITASLTWLAGLSPPLLLYILIKYYAIYSMFLQLRATPVFSKDQCVKKKKKNDNA